jgi:uncharacterized protein
MQNLIFTLLVTSCLYRVFFLIEQQASSLIVITLTMIGFIALPFFDRIFRSSTSDVSPNFSNATLQGAALIMSALSVFSFALHYDHFQNALFLELLMHGGGSVGLGWLIFQNQGNFLTLTKAVALTLVSFIFAFFFFPILGSAEIILSSFGSGMLAYLAWKKFEKIRPAHNSLGRTTQVLTSLVALALVFFAALSASDTLFREFHLQILHFTVETAPALLFAYTIAALLHAIWFNTELGWLSRGGGLKSAAKGMVFGLPLPICSCGVVPLYRSLIQKGVPATAAMAFLIATPEIGVDAIFISLPFLGPELTLFRVIAAASLALLVGWMIGRTLPRKPLLEEHSHILQEETPSSFNSSKRWQNRAKIGLHSGFVDSVDATAPWIALGLFSAAFLGTLLDPEAFTAIPDFLHVPLFAIIGIPMYVCASGATPLAAVLIAKGVSPGAAIAFLLTGPATNLTTYGILRQMHGKNTALRFIGLMLLFSLMIGYFGDHLFPDGQALLPTTPEDASETAPSLIGWIALIGILSVFFASIFRRGLRGFLFQILEDMHLVKEHSHQHAEQHSSENCCS